MALSGRLGLLAALGTVVAGLAAPAWWGVLTVQAVLAAGVVLDLCLAGSPRRLAFSRAGDVSVRLGEQGRVRLTVANTGRRTVRGVLRDAWQPSAGAIAPRARIAVPAGQRRSADFAFRPVRRGDLRAHAVTVRSFGPLGLAARQRSHSVPWTLRVLPPFESRRHLPSRLARLRELDGRASILVRGQGTEFDSLREYVAGDDVRSIDWRATARATGVVVRTWRPERDRRVVIVLDTGRTSAGRVGDAPRLDAAMDAALLLAALATRAGDRVDLLAYDRRVRADVRRPPAARVLPMLVNAMAPLEAELVETDYRGLVSAIAGRTAHRCLVVLVTGLDPAPLEEGLLPSLGPLLRRHLLVIAGVDDPAETALLGGRGDTEAVYGAAAAARVAHARGRVTDRLRRRGVHVVHAIPAELPPVLADTYLELKAAGQL